MSRSRPASNPISYHKHTRQYYVTRGGKRLYLGSDKDEAIKKYHRLGLGFELVQAEPAPPVAITVKELANRFVAAQRANWRDPEGTLKSYKDWLGRFMKDHPRLKAANFSVEKFAAWKLSLKKRNYSAESINHYLSAVRAMFNFAEETEIIKTSPKLKRVKNEPRSKPGSKEKPLYNPNDLKKLIDSADLQLKTMIMLALNCGFGPKDIFDLAWDDIDGERITLPRSKTGVCQTYLLWPETRESLGLIRQRQAERILRRSRKEPGLFENGHVFMTMFYRPWSKDAIAGQFRKLCRKAGVQCHGFYRLRHCASTVMSLVTTPHVQRKFMRHSQLQQQVAYTHIPDVEVDKAVMKAKERLLGPGSAISSEEKSLGQEEVA